MKRIIHRGKSSVATACLVLLACSMPALASSTLTFLGADTGIEDHPIKGKWLGTLLNKAEAACLPEEGSSLHHGKHRKQNAQANGRQNSRQKSKQLDCLKDEIKDLFSDKKITPAEKKVLLSILKNARKGTEGSGTETNQPQTTSAVVKGRITTPDGSAISGVTVTASHTDGSQTATADSTGHFSLSLQAEEIYLLSFSQAGFADQVQIIKAPASGGSIQLEIGMLQRLPVDSFLPDANEKSNFYGVDGSHVRAVRDAFVDAEGNSVLSGSIDVDITPLDTATSAALDAFPGEFMGIAEGANTASPLYSLGAVEFEFTQHGQPLQLAAGATANITLPLYQKTYQNGLPIQVGQTIPLWWLNEASGLWEQQGNGIVAAAADSPTGLALKAAVTHFSWWSAALSMNYAQASITVFGSNAGTALVQATLTNSLGWKLHAPYQIAPLGTLFNSLIFPADTEVCFSAIIAYNTGSFAITPEECISASEGENMRINLAEPLPGSLNISSLTSSTHNPVRVNGKISYPLNRIYLYPTTQETAVSYSLLSGSLPAGIKLTQVAPIRAEITGVPTESGEFAAVIQASNADGKTAQYTIRLDIASTDLLLPPALSTTNVILNAPGTHDLNAAFSTGGPITHWAISNVSNSAGGFSLDTATGVLAILSTPLSWTATLTASNASGSASLQIMVPATGVVTQ